MIHPADDRELGLFFNAGPRPRMTSQAQRDRRARVEWALDGRGYALQCYYTGGLAAVDRDPRLAVALLGREYRPIAERLRARGRRASARTHVVLTEAEVARLMARQVPVRHEIVLGHDGRWYQPEAELPDALGDVDGLLGEGVIERSTWGDLRVDPDGARELLSRSLWLHQVGAGRLDDAEALTALLARVAELPELPAEAEPEEEPTHTAAEARRYLRAIGLGEAARWIVDPRRLERADRDASITSVTELADRHGVRRDWVRRELVRLGCPGAGPKRARIPTAWLSTPAGAEFWVALTAESARVRAERARQEPKVNQLNSNESSLIQLDSYRPGGRLKSL